MSDGAKQTKPGEPQVWRPALSDETPQQDPAAGSNAQLTEEKRPKEYGGRRDGLDPTRYGDWEKNGRCIDF